MQRATILLVEDDVTFQKALARHLTSSGYNVLLEQCGAGALSSVRAHACDLILLDLELPDEEGLSVYRSLRQANVESPIVIYTAHEEPNNKAAALTAGVDDFVGKSEQLEVLLATIANRLAARARVPDRVLGAGPLRVDLRAKAAFLHDRLLDLTTLEFELIRILVEAGGEVVPRVDLMKRLWGTVSEPQRDRLDTHVGNVRRKLGTAAVSLETVRGVGYRWSS